MNETSGLFIAYAAKVVSNAAKFQNPLTTFEHALVSDVLNDALEYLDAKEFPKETFGVKPITQLPSLIRLIGRDSATFTDLYKRCRQLEVEVVDIGENNGGDYIAVDFDDEPVNTIAQLVREMHRFVNRPKPMSTESFYVQKQALRELSEKGYLPEKK